MSYKRSIRISALLLIIFAVITATALTGCRDQDDGGSSHTHSFTDWKTEREATCSNSGEEVRKCSCGKEERRSIAMTDHDYSVFSEWKEDNEHYVSMSCRYCNRVSDAVSKGAYFDTSGTVLLMDCDEDFTFQVVSSYGEDYIRENLKIHNAFFSEPDYNEAPELFEEYSLRAAGEDVYIVSAGSAYLPGNSYIANLSGDLTFAHYPSSSITFEIKQTAENKAEYNQSIIFLKDLLSGDGGERPYEFYYDENRSSHELILSKAGIFTPDSVGKIICIGDCTSFAEAEALPEGSVVFGKIYSVEELEDATRLLLEEPTITDLYSAININADRLDITADDLTEEDKAMLTSTLLKSDAFASAIATANLSAKAYADDYGLYAEDTGLDLNNLTFNMEIEQTQDGSVLLRVFLSYDYDIPIKLNDVSLGSISFNITFEFKQGFGIEIISNIEEYEFLDWDYRFNFRLMISQDTEIDFKLTSKINVSYTYDTEAFYVVNPESGKIHSYDCRMCAGFADDPDARKSYSEITEDETYLERQCKICKPFTTTDSGFLLNMESNIIHCINCESAKNITHGNVKVFSKYPLGYEVNNCKNCKPENHVKDFKSYMDDVLEGGNWSVAFYDVTDMVNDMLEGSGASSIDEDATPRITLHVYCFDIPVFIEPRFDFKLQANLNYEYSSFYSNLYVAHLRYNTQKDKYEFVPMAKEIAAEADLNLDISGQMRAELGAILEVRIAPKFLSKSCYIGLNCGLGLYAEMSGILHADSDNGAYYAARIEAGLYVESYLTYEIKGILDADSLAIFPKDDLPLYIGGDSRVYFAYSDYDKYILLPGTKSQPLPDSLLESIYFDLTSMKQEKEKLDLSGTEQYSVAYRFVDPDGKAVDFCSIEDSSLMISDSAPEEFTVRMIVTVSDIQVPTTLLGYAAMAGDANYALFLDELEVTIERRRCEHQLSYVAPSEPGCDYEGNIAHWTCSICKYNFTDERGETKFDNVTIPANGHNFDDSGKCTVCGDSDPSGLQFILVNHGNEYAVAAIDVARYSTSFTVPAYHNGKPVTTIPSFAFDDCIYMTSITLPDTITEINSYAFDGCSQLRDIKLPDSVTVMENYAFYKCGLLNCNEYGGAYYLASENNPYFALIKPTNSSITACDIHPDTKIITGLAGTSITDITIPDSVICIGGSAFYECYSLENVKFGSNVKFIGEYAFAQCTSLKSAILNDGVERVMENAFSKCTSLTKISIPDSITEIYSGEFNDNTALFTEYGGAYYVGNAENKYLVLIGAANNEITSCNVHKDTKVIASCAFRECYDLENISIPEGLKAIGTGAFSGCRLLSDVILPESLTYIGMMAFGSCSGLKEIVIPGGVKVIEDQAFYYCGSLEKVTFSRGVECIGKEAFAFCSSLSRITLGENIKAIDEGAFNFCKKLTAITLPQSLTYISTTAFQSCDSLMSITVESGNTVYHAKDNCLIETRTKKLVIGLASSIIPADGSVTSIGKYAFSYCAGLLELVIPDSVKTVETYAFEHCESLKSVVIGDGVETIGEYAFAGCSSLVSVDIGKSVTTIESGAFNRCSSLESIFIPINVTHIKKYAFTYCSKLTIYAEAESQPAYWNSWWNYSNGNLPVVWAYKK